MAIKIVTVKPWESRYYGAVRYSLPGFLELEELSERRSCFQIPEVVKAAASITAPSEIETVLQIDTTDVCEALGIPWKRSLNKSAGAGELWFFKDKKGTDKHRKDYRLTHAPLMAEFGSDITFAHFLSADARATSEAAQSFASSLRSKEGAGKIEVWYDYQGGSVDRNLFASSVIGLRPFSSKPSATKH